MVITNGNYFWAKKIISDAMDTLWPDLAILFCSMDHFTFDELVIIAFLFAFPFKYLRRNSRECSSFCNSTFKYKVEPEYNYECIWNMTESGKRKWAEKNGLEICNNNEYWVSSISSVCHRSDPCQQMVWWIRENTPSLLTFRFQENHWLLHQRKLMSDIWFQRNQKFGSNF